MTTAIQRSLLMRDLSNVDEAFRAGTDKWTLALVVAEERIDKAVRNPETDAEALRAIAHMRGQVIETLTDRSIRERSAVALEDMSETD